MNDDERLRTAARLMLGACWVMVATAVLAAAIIVAIAIRHR